jgi:isopentenyldiphosphate isomerase
MSERIDIVDENGEPTGETVDREYAHLNGIWHRTSHLWLIREKDGCIQILLQKRSKNKDSYPNCYDISSAGHIPAGIDYKPSAIRELKEELGIDANEKDLIFCGDRKIILDDSFHGKEFHDRQHSRVFMMWCNLSVDKFMICEDEVESICWMNFDSCYEGVKNNLFLNCISIEELEMLRKSFVL